jgi:hypothetical protein
MVTATMALFRASFSSQVKKVFPPTWATDTTAGPLCTASMPRASTGLRLSAAPPEHAIGADADEGVPLKNIADVIGRRLGVPVVSNSLEEAADHFGWLAQFAPIDMVASSAQTQEQLGWCPTQPGLSPISNGDTISTCTPRLPPLALCKKSEENGGVSF